MKKIESLVSLDDSYGRAVTRGIIRYAKTQPQWKLYGYGNLFPSMTVDGDRKPDGIIARIESPEHAEILSKMDIPIVDVAGAYPMPGISRVNNDDEQTGSKAGTYFRQLGFISWALCGVENVSWWQHRKEGFLSVMDHLIGPPSTFERPLSWWKSQDEGVEELSNFVSNLRPGTALFAANDLAGLKIARVCARKRISVPQDISILGVDDDDLFCELSLPSLSSVALDCEEIGFRAACVLDQVQESGAPGPRTDRSTLAPHLVAPKSVIERQSTQVLVCNDKLVSLAANWIRNNVQARITVSDLLGYVSASRRSLEQRFQKALGRTPHDEIVLARLKKAKTMLAGTNQTMDTVARAAGFGSLQRFYIVFKDVEGVSPGEWRARARQ